MHTAEARELGDERAQHLLGLALTGEPAEGAGVDARPQRVDVLTPQCPDDLGDDEADRDQGLDRPEVGRVRLLSAGDERRVVTDDREGRRRDGADRAGPESGNADREDVEDPWTELERQCERESGHRGEVEDGHDEGDLLQWGVVPHADCGREVDDQDERGERGRADPGEQHECSAEGDRCETDEQMGALPRYGGCRRPSHCDLLTRPRRLAVRDR